MYPEHRAMKGLKFSVHKITLTLTLVHGHTHDIADEIDGRSLWMDYTKWGLKN